MKMNLKLGVPTEAMLKHPTACFRLSNAVTRVQDALAFGLFYVRETKTPSFLPRDLEHISASVHSTGGAARMLAMLIDDKDLRDEVSAYNSTADRFNKRIREGLKKDAKAMPSKASIEKGLKNLSEKLSEIYEKVEDLCTVKPLPAPPPVANPALKGPRPRIGMAGGAPKKRPIYPRYFVASMGRSRR